MVKNKLPTDILRISDSPYKKEIERLINDITLKDSLIQAAFILNIATLLVCFLLGFGLAINIAVVYFGLAFSLIVIGLTIKIFLVKKQPSKLSKIPVLEIIDDSVFLCAIPTIYYSNQTIDIVLVIYFILGGLFLTSFFTIKYLQNYLIIKGVVFLVCIYFTTDRNNETLPLIYNMFSLATIYILLICLACWIYIRQIRLYHMNASYRDVYQKAEQANKDLNELKNKRDKLIRHIGHDLRQPINAVDYALFNIKANRLNPMQQSQVDNAQASIEDINTMIEEMLKLSIDKGAKTISMTKQTFNIGDLLLTLYDENKGLAMQQGSQLHVSTSSLIIETDRKLLARILRNFLSNAINYGYGGKILLGVRRREKSINIQVMDQGQGISNEQLNIIFDEYTHVSSEHDAKGLGLGLNVAQYLANVINAQVSIKSQIGRGTVCTVSLPRPIIVPSS